MAALTANQAAWLESRGVAGPFRALAGDAYCDGTARDPALLLEQTRMFDVLRELRGLDWALRNPDAGELDDAGGKVAAALAGYA